MGRGIAVSVAVALVLFAGVVLYAIHRAPKPRGFSGLQFSALSPSASARTPLLIRGGAEVAAVMDNSPADKAEIKPGEVVSAIDGVSIQSARQASDLVRKRGAGDRVIFTLYDITKGEVHPRTVSLTFDAAPPVSRKFSVRPPRTLAKEVFGQPFPAAHASWSRRIYLGPTIKPLALSGLGAGQCNAFAPDGWRVAAHAPDNSLFHLMAGEGFVHAVYVSGQFQDTDVGPIVAKTFGSAVTLTPPQSRPSGFVVRDWGNARGGAGFVLYRSEGGRTALWIVAVAGAEAGWAKPLAGAVALSMRCAAPGKPAPGRPVPPLADTSVSLRCQQGDCDETDFAASYLSVLRLGYVHNLKGDMFLVHPRKDFWVNGAEGPGYYHQIGGENERLMAGRIN
ncbi:MAG: PDZ domain-containing protein [Alphaproteobacteria bacterium]|nr:PDZ domain-containing protein [Alphaproteobacteria bacterium]